MHYGAKKVLIRVLQTGENLDDVLGEFKERKMHWLAYPAAEEADDQKLVTWTKQVFGNDGAIGKTVKYVSSFANNTDHVAIVVTISSILVPVILSVISALTMSLFNLFIVLKIV